MKTYIINLPHRKDRLDNLIPRLPFKNYEVVSAFHWANESLNSKRQYVEKFFGFPSQVNSEGAAGCIISHISAWIKFLESGEKVGMIVEDDVIFTNDFKNHFNYLECWFDILFIGGGMLQTTPISTPFGQYHPDFNNKNAFCTEAYIITREGAEKLLKLAEVEKINLNIDWWLHELGKAGKINYLAYNPLLAVQSHNNSDIVVPKNRKNLIIVPVNNNSLHYEWVEDKEYKNFDIAGLYYEEGEDEKVIKSVDIFYKGKGFKPKLIRDFLNKNPKLINDYDYIFIPDNDVRMTTRDINLFFEINRALDLFISQPSMTQQSYGSHSITYHNPNYGLRFTNFVEVMMPCFSSKIFSLLFPSFYESESSWGLDNLWPYLLNYPKDKIAIIDQIQVTHTKKIESSKPFIIEGITIDGHKDFNNLLSKYNFDTNHKVYGVLKFE
jgi:GR25 family glycosyltransferase involved in LPS biosynthesis